MNIRNNKFISAINVLNSSPGVILLIVKSFRIGTGLIWHFVGSSGGLLWTVNEPLGFHERRRIYWPALRPLASQYGLYSMKLVNKWTSRAMRNTKYQTKLWKHMSNICFSLEYTFPPLVWSIAILINTGSHSSITKTLFSVSCNVAERRVWSYMI